MNMIKFYQSCKIPADSQLMSQIIHLKTMHELLSQKISQAQARGISQQDKFEIINDYQILKRRNNFLKLLVENREKSLVAIAANFR